MQVSIIHMTKKTAEGIAGTLTTTSKMPCKSYSLSPEHCKVGAKLAKVKGSICSTCYACKGFYKVYEKQIKASQQKRLDGISRPEWVSAMVSLIGAAKYFRWHDSGDLQSLDHLNKIVSVANATSDCLHWLPTREFSIIGQWLRRNGSFPANLIVRLSATFFDQAVETNLPVNTATAHKDQPAIGFECPAPKQGGACKECRACWNANVKNVSYHAH